MNPTSEMPKVPIPTIAKEIGLIDTSPPRNPCNDIFCRCWVSKYFCLHLSIVMLTRVGPRHTLLYMKYIHRQRNISFVAKET